MGKACHLCLKLIRRNLDTGARRFHDCAGVFDLKIDLLDVSSFYADGMNLAFGPKINVFAIRAPIHIWIHALHAPRLLHVLVELIENHSLFAALKVFYEKVGICADALDEGQIFAVR